MAWFGLPCDDDDDNSPSNFQYRLRREYHRRALAEDKLLFGDPNWEKELEKQERELERERLRALEDGGPEVKGDAMEVDGEEEKGASSVVGVEGKDGVGAQSKADDGESKERDEIKEKKRPKLWSDIGMDDKVRTLFPLPVSNVLQHTDLTPLVTRAGSRAL